MTITVTNPATGHIQNSYPLMNQEQVAQIIDTMHHTQQQWIHVLISQRQQYVQQLAYLLRDQAKKHATLITEEMGKPITQSLAEIEKCALLCDYYVEQAAHLLQPEPIATDKGKTYRYFQPLGIIFAIMPWNFPFWQVFRFAIPNLIGGNAALLKHAPNSTGTALAIEALCRQAGFPPDLFRSLIIDVDLVPFVIHHPSIQGVTLTGSHRAGQSVAREAGVALKKIVLELGGSDPYIILEDANLAFAAEQCAISRFINTGQSCIAAKRIIVVEKIKATFEHLLIEQAQSYICGPPLDPQTNLGPLAREDLRQNLHEQVQRSIAAGARCVLGGICPTSPGYYYPATVLLDVKQGSPAFTEEIFGPVLCVITAENETEALTLANETPYGLGAAVFTQDSAKGERIATQILQAGTCAVNGFIASDPRLPFGGIKQSGYGRELSLEGLREFMNIKTIILHTNKAAQSRVSHGND
jgi:succinate-semialdehyde dehydrogenase / glutarate-semialdehyde dehydrogenase